MSSTEQPPVSTPRAVEATDFDEEYGQVVDVKQLIVELEKRGWRSEA